MAVAVLAAVGGVFVVAVLWARPASPEQAAAPAPATTVTAAALAASDEPATLAVPTPTAPATAPATAIATPAASDTTLPAATSRPTATPAPAPATAASFPPPAEGLPTPPTPVPTPVPPWPIPAETTNILLLGNDVDWPQGGRTDAIMILSINRRTATASLLTIPRDLYLYVPGWTMNRVNLALPHGHGIDYQGNSGGGGGLIKDTILYNLGVPVDHYVRVGFAGFRHFVDELGGLDLVVNCPLRDWRLKSPELDPAVAENWQQFELEPGLHTMDGDLALWYARSRLSSNDFERGRRQQQLLRSALTRGLDAGLLPQLPDLWRAWQQEVETDLTLSQLLELAALAPAVRENGIQHLYLAGTAVRAWQVPQSGESVQLLNWPAAEPILRQFMAPPVLNRAERPPLTVTVVTEDWIMYRQVAENLAWYGFVPVYEQPGGPDPVKTKIWYYAPNFKGSYDWLLSWIFRQEPDDIALVDESYETNYRVELGQDHNPCLPPLFMPLQPPPG